MEGQKRRMSLPVLGRNETREWVAMARRPRMGISVSAIEDMRQVLAENPESRLNFLRDPLRMLRRDGNDQGPCGAASAEVFPGVGEESIYDTCTVAGVFCVAYAWVAAVSTAALGYTAAVAVAVYAYTGIYGSPMEAPEPMTLVGYESAV